MALDIEDGDSWLFRELYSVLTAFADKPESTISRIGNRIAVTEDQANHLHHFRRSILEKYPEAADLAVMRLAADIDELLDRRSNGSPDYEEGFWTNRAFSEHPDWQWIRRRAREFLLR
ncbi:MAG: hypothetical protein U0800_19265 [Isosphaeraceae bacterium]